MTTSADTAIATDPQVAADTAIATDPQVAADTAIATDPQVAAPAAGRAGPRPDIDPEQSGIGERILVAAFVAVPMLALLVAVPLAWGWGLGWRDVVLAIGCYAVSGLGISMGFHRYFTHGSFKAVRPFRIALAVAGTLAIEGPVLTWVADHRRHHKYSDREGDPHSPWRFGDDWKALTKGLLFAPRSRSSARTGSPTPTSGGSPGGSPGWSLSRCWRRPSSAACGRCPGRAR
jgi:Fatty acid desaturase